MQEVQQAEWAAQDSDHRLRFQGPPDGAAEGTADGSGASRPAAQSDVERWAEQERRQWAQDRGNIQHRS